MHILHGAFLALVLLFVVACTGAPVDRGVTVHMNYREDALGEQYRYSADEVSATWTFNQEAAFVLRFDDGAVSYEGVSLEPGCYSDVAREGAIIEADDAISFELQSPASDEGCSPPS